MIQVHQFAREGFTPLSPKEMSRMIKAAGTDVAAHWMARYIKHQAKKWIRKNRSKLPPVPPITEDDCF